MRNLDKSARMKEIAKKDSLPIEVLQLDVTDDKSVTDAIDVISNRQGRIVVLLIMRDMNTMDQLKNFRWRK